MVNQCDHTTYNYNICFHLMSVGYKHSIYENQTKLISELIINLISIFLALYFGNLSSL